MEEKRNWSVWSVHTHTHHTSTLCIHMNAYCRIYELRRKVQFMFYKCWCHTTRCITVLLRFSLSHTHTLSPTHKYPRTHTHTKTRIRAHTRAQTSIPSFDGSFSEIWPLHLTKILVTSSFSRLLKKSYVKESVISFSHEILRCLHRPSFNLSFSAR